jgi:hypothetical protein
MRNIGRDEEVSFGGKVAERDRGRRRGKDSKK